MFPLARSSVRLPSSAAPRAACAEDENSVVVLRFHRSWSRGSRFGGRRSWRRRKERPRTNGERTVECGGEEKEEGVLLSFGLCRISQLLPRGLSAQSLFIDALRARQRAFLCQRPGRKGRKNSIVVIPKRDNGQDGEKKRLTPKGISCHH